MAVIPNGFGQANFVLPTATWPRVPQVTLGIDYDGFVGTGQEAANTLYQAFSDEILPEMTSNTTLQEVRFKVGPNNFGPTYIASGTDTGTAGVDTEPPPIALLVGKVSLLGGRQHRGRMYVPGVADANVFAGGTIDPAALAAWQTAFNGFWAALTAVELNPVILHGEGSSDLVPTPIESFEVRARAGVQRRRNRG